MRRMRRLGILLGVLVVACVATFAATRYEAHQEQIANSDEIILEISPEEVQSLSWEENGESLAFHQEDGWHYDEDDSFPVDEEKIAQLLEPFQAFGVSFVIEDVEDYGQYGLDDPECIICLETEEETYELSVGDFSTMDEQRYVSLGDGKVYLVSTDPMDLFDLELKDLIDQDEVPTWDLVNQIQFSGTQEEQIDYILGSDSTYREEDTYFLQEGDEDLPLDSDRVEDYLSTLQNLDLTNYVTYNATQEELADCGLDDPELTIQVSYTWEDEDNVDQNETFLLSVSRDPEEAAQAAEDEGEEDETEEETITAYARVGESPILYQITSSEYEALMAASYDDLRHQEIFPADFQQVTQVDITLEGEEYTITAQGDEEERTYLYQEEELDLGTFQSALESLTAQEFTQEQPEGQEEIRMTLTLDLEGEPQVELVLYRYDGTNCLAVVDGAPVALVLRSAVVDLVESVNQIVLNG